MAIPRLKQLTGAIADRIATMTTSGTTIEFPGRHLETGTINDWVRVRVESVRREPQRTGNTDRGNVRICIEIAAKLTTNVYRSRVIERDIRSILRHAEIAIKDFEDSSEPVVGHLSVFEPEMSNQAPEWAAKRTDVAVISLEFPGQFTAA